MKQILQDHSQEAMPIAALSVALVPEGLHNELPCLAGLLTRLSLSPSHADEPHSGLIMTDLTQTYSSGHCCRFARHSLNQSDGKDTIFLDTIAKKNKEVPKGIGTSCKATTQANKRDSVPLAGRLSFL